MTLWPVIIKERTGKKEDPTQHAEPHSCGIHGTTVFQQRCLLTSPEPSVRKTGTKKVQKQNQWAHKAMKYKETLETVH